jgi:hypothetical protein
VTKRVMARMTRVMAMVTKRAMVTDSDTMGNGYRCPSSSVVAAAAVAVAAVVVAAAGKDDKGRGGPFLYCVVVKKYVCAFSQF